MNVNNDPYFRALQKRLMAVEKDMQRVFMNYAKQAAKVLDNPAAKFPNAFTLSSNEKLSQVLSGEQLKLFQSELYEVVKNAATGAYEMGYQRNDGIVNEYLKKAATGAGMEFKDVKSLYGELKYNDKALRAFLSGRGAGALSGHKGQPSLSSRVWKIAREFRDEMTVHLGMGLANGDSAAVVSQRIRRGLQEPDNLFRRVKYIGKDKEGNVVEKFRWSRRAQNYHPGRGKYRSAFKNAMRVTRTTTNQSYWLADQENWRRQRFVESYQVKLSHNHPKPDICDDLAGTYPKDFIFTGWHPQCFCYVTPNLMKPEKFIKYLKGERVAIKQTKLPSSFQGWMKNNIDSNLVKGESKPWWFRDNITVDKSGNYRFGGETYTT